MLLLPQTPEPTSAHAQGKCDTSLFPPVCDVEVGVSLCLLCTAGSGFAGKPACEWDRALFEIVLVHKKTIKHDLCHFIIMLLADYATLHMSFTLKLKFGTWIFIFGPIRQQNRNCRPKIMAKRGLNNLNRFRWKFPTPNRGFTE